MKKGEQKQSVESSRDASNSVLQFVDPEEKARELLLNRLFTHAFTVDLDKLKTLCDVAETWNENARTHLKLGGDNRVFLQRLISRVDERIQGRVGE